MQHRVRIFGQATYLWHVTMRFDGNTWLMCELLTHTEVERKTNERCYSVAFSKVGLAFHTFPGKWDIRISRLSKKCGKILMLTLHFILPAIFNILPAWKYKHKHCSLFCSQINQETSKPKLAPLNEGGVSELLNKVNKHYIACTDRFDCKK